MTIILEFNVLAKSYFLFHRTIYKSKFIMENNSKVEFSDSIMMKIMKENGKEDKMENKSKSVTSVTTITGELNSKNELKAIIQYDDMDIEMTGLGNQIAAEDDITKKIMGSKIYVTISDSNNVSIDSISGTQDDMMKSIISNTMKSVMNSVRFPNYKIKIGDTFVIDAPLNLPLPSMKAEFVIRSTYKLNSIKNDVAHFSVDQKISSKLAMEEMELKIDGTGQGFMEYDLKQQNCTTTETNMQMNMLMPIRENIMTVVTKSKVRNEVVVLKK